jgi:hypothetical protein
VREQFDGKGFDFGYAATPLVEEGHVILPVGGAEAALVSLSAEDGHTLWTAGSGLASYCPALPITFEGRRCIVGYLQNSLLIVEAASGRVLLRRELSTGYDEHSVWPLYREPDLLLTRPFRLPAECLRLSSRAGDVLDAKPLWSCSELANDVASSVLVAEHLYGFDLKQLQASRHRPSRGSFRCLEWGTGKVAWSTERVGHASVLAADGKLFLFNDSGELILARANPERYEELGHTRLFDGEICWTAPALDRGRLYLRSPSRLVCVDVRARAGGDTAETAASSSTWHLDPSWLLTREREYPNDAFTGQEMLVWYAACLGVLVVAAVGTMLIQVAARNRNIPTIPTFLGLTFVLGLLGPNLLSAWFDTCLFTWPVSLYAALHVAIWTGRWAERNPERRGARWRARLALLGFLLVNFAYFELCKIIGMFLAWAFLFGFVPGLPLTWLAGRCEVKRGRAWVVGGWTLLAFSSFFWGVHLFVMWKAARGAP